MYNDLLHSSGNYPADKIEEWITFALIHARLYLSESDNEQDGKSAVSKKSIHPVVVEDLSSLSAINVSVLDTSNVVCCLIFTSDRFLPNDPLSSDDMVDRDNDSMLGIGGGDTNIYEG